MISASVVSPQITASVSGSTISATVAAGIGPSGVTTISGASDVFASNLANGDVLRYDDGKWRNYPDTNLVDGGNW